MNTKFIQETVKTWEGKIAVTKLIIKVSDGFWYDSIKKDLELFTNCLNQEHGLKLEIDFRGCEDWALERIVDSCYDVLANYLKNLGATTEVTIRSTYIPQNYLDLEEFLKKKKENWVTSNGLNSPNCPYCHMSIATNSLCCPYCYKPMPLNSPHIIFDSTPLPVIPEEPHSYFSITFGENNQTGNLWVDLWGDFDTNTDTRKFQHVIASLGNKELRINIKTKALAVDDHFWGPFRIMGLNAGGAFSDLIKSISPKNKVTIALQAEDLTPLGQSLRYGIIVSRNWRTPDFGSGWPFIDVELNGKILSIDEIKKFNES
jgi:hypothetical protein